MSDILFQVLPTFGTRTPVGTSYLAHGKQKATRFFSKNFKCKAAKQSSTRNNAEGDLSACLQLLRLHIVPTQAQAIIHVLKFWQDV